MSLVRVPSFVLLRRRSVSRKKMVSVNLTGTPQRFHKNFLAPFRISQVNQNGTGKTGHFLQFNKTSRLTNKRSTLKSTLSITFDYRLQALIRSLLHIGFRRHGDLEPTHYNYRHFFGFGLSILFGHVHKHFTPNAKRLRRPVYQTNDNVINMKSREVVTR